MTSSAPSGSNGRLRLLFVRHGETQDNIDRILQGWRDTSLTDKGHKDAQTVAAKLKDHKIEAIYHSPLIRILQTIEPIAADHPDVPKYSDRDLTGQGLGELEGQSYDKINLNSPRSADGQPGVELFNDYVLRLKKALARIVGREAPLVPSDRDRAVVVGTHGVSITSIFKMLEATPECDMFNPKFAVRGPDAYEVRYPDSTDVAELVVLQPTTLPIKDGLLDWDALSGEPFYIERWGRKENAILTK